MAKINIRDLTGDTWLKAGRLQVSDEQANFVAPNMESIAWSKYEKDLIPAGIYADDEVVGFVLYGKWPDEPNRWGIARYMIDKNHQGKGYGKAGMLETIRMIREQHPEATGLKLAYVPNNEVARSLYASVGFRETGDMWDDQVIAALDFVPTEPAAPASQEPAQSTTPAETGEISIQPLTRQTMWAAVDLKVADDQETFVSSNVESLALSRFLPDWIPAGIYAGDEMVGFVFYGPKQDKWHIMRYMIDKNCQGKGYGKAALKVVIEDILSKAPEVKVIDLSVVPENALAIHVYESLGFVLTGEIHHDEAVMLLDVENVWKARHA